MTPMEAAQVCVDRCHSAGTIPCVAHIAYAIRVAVAEERKAAADVASRNGAPMIAALIRSRSDDGS